MIFYNNMGWEAAFLTILFVSFVIATKI
jgi:hypothetical protein